MYLQRPSFLWLFLLIPAMLCVCATLEAQDSDDVFPNELNSSVAEPQIELPEIDTKSPFRNVSTSRRRGTEDKLVLLCREAVDTTSRRLLSTDQHTPWQMMHALLGLRQDFQILHNGQAISGLDWIKQGQIFDNEYWFEKTRFGGRAHPYNRPWAFEGHANQFLAILSMCGVALDQEFTTANGEISMRGMIQNAQMTLSEKDEPTWTLWALSRYLPPTARWRNAAGQAWSIEKLIQNQCAKPIVRGAPCGGTHALFALAHARNVYLRQGKPLRGVWLQAEYKIRKYINTARMQQNSNGSLSSDFFRGRKYEPDFNKRMASAGHVLEFLMIALPQKELNARWVRRAIESTAQDLLNNRKSYVKCSPLYHSVDALNIYLDRVNPKLTPNEIAKLEQDNRTVEVPQTMRAEVTLKPVPFSSISKSRDLPAAIEEHAVEPNDIANLPEPKAAESLGSTLPPARLNKADRMVQNIPILNDAQLRNAIERDKEKWSATPEERRTPIEVPADERDVTGIPEENELPAAVVPNTLVLPNQDVDAEVLMLPDVNTRSLNITEAHKPIEKVAPEEIENTRPDGVPAKSVSISKPVDPIVDPPSTTVADSPNRSAVPVGINRLFLDPNLNTEDWLEKFEIESREIYAGRQAIVDAIGLEEGMSIADVGSGTGLFLTPFSKAVGASGHVFAIDISPRFVDHLEERVAREKLDNVDVVRNEPKSLMLMKHKVDRVFLCDTYHHFEHPQEMLASIFGALRPGGEFLLIDFDRIPGKSREWLLNHVRADRQTFQDEIAMAGFEYVEEVTIPGFQENYFLRFRKRTSR